MDERQHIDSAAGSTAAGLPKSHRPASGPHAEEPEFERFFPHEIIKFSIIISLIVAGVTFFATMMPLQVGAPADPLRTPAGIEPEWYFLAVYQLLKYVPRWLAISFSFIFFPFVLITVPFYWSIITRRSWGLRALQVVVTIGVLAALLLSLLAFLGFE